MGRLQKRTLVEFVDGQWDAMEISLDSLIYIYVVIYTYIIYIVYIYIYYCLLKVSPPGCFIL